MADTDFSEGMLECTVDKPQKENDGTKDAYISYLSDFQSFQRPEFSVRRRFTDFVFLWKTLSKEYPQCAVPPLPDKHKMEYVRGDRFGPDFTQRRASSLRRFLKRLTQHPVLRRSAIFLLFLESSDWNQTMRSRPQRSMSGTSGDQGSGGVFDSFTDTLMGAFSKVHKPDKRFVDVRERADKLDEDLGLVEKVVARVARRQGDLSTDYADLAAQCQKLVALEPGVEQSLTSFATSVETTSQGLRGLHNHTEHDYLGSLRDMDAYIDAVKLLLKTRENKQLDFESLTDYLTKAAADRDTLASASSTAALGASGFLRAKVEDIRGVDHEQSRRDRVRKLELQIERLTREVEDAKRTSEAFDEQTVKEVQDFERIKALEFKDTLGDLADAHIDFFANTAETWEVFLEQMEREQRDQAEAQATAA
ncbi:Lipid binding protein [Lasiodiplodia theobromae]|uniref:Lipid binding protein n=1 Tax=Lasiodiplodia theobromae TaxID=45133 RepID=UPI0015C2CA2F|nr:Lipid binding protein [Lasiodiplodia theobromae]KAF4538364.1 Lipid binding protein [Lasiodiplodia theobromae]